MDVCQMDEQITGDFLRNTQVAVEDGCEVVLLLLQRVGEVREGYDAGKYVAMK